MLLGLANRQWAGPENRNRHFWKLRISPVNKENNPLFFTAMNIRTRNYIL